MHLYQQLVGNNVVRLRDGKIVGQVTRIFLDEDRRAIDKLALTGNRVVNSEQIALLGDDIVVIRFPNAIKGNSPARHRPLGGEPDQSSMIQSAKESLSKEATGHNWWVHCSSTNI